MSNGRGLLVECDFCATVGAADRSLQPDRALPFVEGGYWRRCDFCWFTSPRWRVVEIAVTDE